MDADHCYRVASSRDGRFDGTFVTAVLTTGIYCRPSCPAVTPRRENVRFYPTPAAAQEAGFRACKRCRPDAAPGSPEWDARADLVARAVRLIGDGVVEREGIGGLSKRLGYSPRQLHRLVSAELGTGPLRLAMAHRVQNARALLENTDLPVTEVAWAAGFGSIRQFNDRVRHVFALTPSEIRARRPADRNDRSGGGHAGPGDQSEPTGQPQSGHRPGPTGQPGRPAHTVIAHLSYRPPLDLVGLLQFLGRRAIPGVESWNGRTYTRALDLPHGLGAAQIDAPRAAQPDAASTRSSRHRRRDSHPAVPCRLFLEDIRDYSTAVARMRRLLDLDADPTAVRAAFDRDPLIHPLVEAEPGRRIPGSVAPFELAVRAVVGQGVSLASSGAACGFLATRFGRPLRWRGPEALGVHRTFPGPEELAGADPADLRMPVRRAASVVALARAVTDGLITLDPGCDRDQTERRLLGVPGIGPWTAAYIRMRALGDPDVFPPGDLWLERALRRGGSEPLAGAGIWKPWRSYAVVHLWAAADPRGRKTT